MSGESGPEQAKPWWPKFFDPEETARRAEYLARPKPKSLSAASIHEIGAGAYNLWQNNVLGDIHETNGMGCMPVPGANARPEASEMAKGLGQPPMAAA